MDNSGRREAPITFFFLFEFCFIQDILPQGSPDRKVNNIRKGFLVIHRLWMSLLVVSSGIFFWIWLANSMNLHLRWIFHLTPIPICCERHASFIGVQINLFCSAIQFVFLSNSICFPQQFNLFSSAIQFVFLGNSIYFAEQRNIHKHATRYIQAYYMAFQQHRENRSFEVIDIRQCQKVWPWWSVRTSTPSATVGRVARNGIFPACHCLS